MTVQKHIKFPYSSVDVRVVMIDDAPWFIASDICSVLEFKNHSDALKRLDEDERKSLKNNSIDINDGVINQQLNPNQEIIVINESGLYSLILTSRKAEAKKFKKWVTNEVLPSIRKTGSYTHPSVPTAPMADELLTDLQLRQLGELVHSIGMCFHQQESAKWAVYAGIRDTKGISQINQLPSREFNNVYGTVHLLREKAQEYLKLRIAVDSLVIKQVLRNHQLQLPLQADLFLPS
jgi:prophage antirepressor-like protein